MGDQTWTPIPGADSCMVTAAGPDGVTLSRKPSSVRGPPQRGLTGTRRHHLASGRSDAEAVERVLIGSAAVAFPRSSRCLSP